MVKWLGYAFSIDYKKGSTNVMVNTLSKKYEGLGSTVCIKETTQVHLIIELSDTTATKSVKDSWTATVRSTESPSIVVD